jgi:leader peptidase (prepilin peptidase)/N-methyltransferase
VLQLSGTISYLLSRAKCAGCGVRLPIRHIVVEWATAALFLLLWWRFGWGIPLALVSFYVLVLILTFVTDVEHRRILNVVLLPAIVIAVIGGFFDPRLGMTSSLVGGGVGLAIFAGLVLLGRALFGRGALGEGDVTLATFLGLTVGFPQIILVVILAILLGGVGGVLFLSLRRGGRRSHMPYGPYLILGGLVGLLYGQEIVNWYLYSYLPA